MRENMGLFKAKEIENSEWIQGSLIHQTDYYGSPCNKWFILDGTTTVDYEIGEAYLVDPETVCECTGLKDKNGKLIFEGDVVNWNGHEVSAANGKSVQIRPSRILPIASIEGFVHLYNLSTNGVDYMGIEIIGNIFDNPELLNTHDQ